MTVTDIASILQENYIYEEELPIFNWVIFNETQSILSYDCQKATTSFRGRDYIAWFAPAIPISNGPWKFGGLPGLILKLCDTKEEFVFECNGLEQLNE
ncbi:GLPGLI family protein, partial [Bacteroidales bacterium OttesenSCG-928-I14]|nr:GLPGLI family protein [Bacteroidales bacterium OttesenSCG-928-I14]